MKIDETHDINDIFRCCLILTTWQRLIRIKLMFLNLNQLYCYTIFFFINTVKVITPGDLLFWGISIKIKINFQLVICVWILNAL